MERPVPRLADSGASNATLLPGGRASVAKDCGGGGDALPGLLGYGSGIGTAPVNRVLHGTGEREDWAQV